MIAGRGWSPAREYLVQQFEINDLVGFHEEPVGKRMALPDWSVACGIGAGDLIAEQLG